MSTTTMISLVGTAVVSVATLVYAVYKKTEENKHLREENIRMEERSMIDTCDDDEEYPIVKKKKKKKKKNKYKGAHWEYDPEEDEWVLVGGEPYYEPAREEIIVRGYPYPDEYYPPIRRTIYREPVYDNRRYIRPDPYNPGNRYYQDYQTHCGYPTNNPYYDNYGYNDYRRIDYGWGDNTPYFGNPYGYEQGGYCPAAYNSAQVL